MSPSNSKQLQGREGKDHTMVMAGLFVFIGINVKTFSIM